MVPSGFSALVRWVNGLPITAPVMVAVPVASRPHRVPLFGLPRIPPHGRHHVPPFGTPRTSPYPPLGPPRTPPLGRIMSRLLARLVSVRWPFKLNRVPRIGFYGCKCQNRHVLPPVGFCSNGHGALTTRDFHGDAVRVRYQRVDAVFFRRDNPSRARQQGIGMNGLGLQLSPNIRSCSIHLCGRERARPDTVRPVGAVPSAIAPTMRGDTLGESLSGREFVERRRLAGED
jgi:hypothetical protein